MSEEEHQDEAERDAFEHWFENDAYPLEHSNWFRKDTFGDYDIDSVNYAWEIWKAAIHWKKNSNV